MTDKLQPLPRYHPLLAAGLMVATASSIVFLPNAVSFLFALMADLSMKDFASLPNAAAVRVIVLMISAVFLLSLTAIWQYVRLYDGSTINSYQLWRRYFGLVPPAKNTMLPALTVLAAAILLSTLASVMLDEWFATPSASAGVGNLLGSTPLPLFIILVLIVAPIYEEWICRGLFWRLGQDIFVAFFRQMAVVHLANSILISAIFSLLHFGYSGADLLTTFGISLALCYVRLRTKSTIAAMALHSLNNALALALYLLD
ncbi:CPBP family intramembrane glutamic endopeptidase [Moraxella cuniculi]|uniref:CAAX amino terminal protease self- immunity n=1 Tax=Moraxella cuniculi TaxID=34061 RepID=A0A448GYF1_9GAMM|nr:CPBP family intramembrane glutamic endopeptidase [Moraxella cuniculi]VEG13817.1 CAAX amino terminal protease self- immunity [Moraxella cuniculi]